MLSFYVRPLSFVFFDYAVFNEDIFRCVWRDYLSHHYIVVTLHLAVRLHKLRRKGGGFASGILRHPGKVICHGADKGVRGCVDVRGILHGGQLVFSDIIIQVPEGTVQGVFHGISSYLFQLFSLLRIPLYGRRPSQSIGENVAFCFPLSMAWFCGCLLPG